MRNRITAFAEDNLPQMLEDIKTLVSIPSVKGDPAPGKPYGAEVAKAVECMERIAHKHGFKTKQFGGHMLEVNLNELEDELGILCHLDVVHEGTGWSTPPYDPVIRDGKLYGRGTADNKGPAIAALYAMKCVRELGFPLQKNVRLMLGTDEESGCGDLKEYFKSQPLPNYCFSPDAAFPVYNTEKGLYGPTFESSFPKSDRLPKVLSVEGGYAANIVPDKAFAEVEGLDRLLLNDYIAACIAKTGVTFTTTYSGDITGIEAVGVNAHAAYPGDGNNALTAMIELLASIPFSRSAGQERLQALAKLFPHGDWLAQAMGINMEDSLSGVLTCNLGIFKYSLTGLKGKLDLRCPICSNPENTSKIMEKQFAENNFSIDTTEMIPSHHVPEDLPFVRTLLSVFETYTGIKGECLAMGGTTYVHGMRNSVAFGAAYPDTETHAHFADEYAVIEELKTCVKIFAQVIIDICGP